MALVDAHREAPPAPLDVGTAPRAIPPLAASPVLTPSQADSPSSDSELFMAGILILLRLVILAGLFGLLLLRGTILR